MDDTTLRLHQLFAPAKQTSAPNNSGTHHDGNEQPIAATSDAFVYQQYEQQQQQQQQRLVGGTTPSSSLSSSFRSFYSNNAIDPIATTPRAVATLPFASSTMAPAAMYALDSVELEQYAINHVAHTFASPSIAVPPSMFDIDAGYAYPQPSYETTTQLRQSSYAQAQPQFPPQQQRWDDNAFTTLDRSHLLVPVSAATYQQPLPYTNTNSSSRTDDTNALVSTDYQSHQQPVRLVPTSAATASTTTTNSTTAPSAQPLLVEKRRATALSTNMRWISAKEASKAVNDYALFVQKKRARMDKRTSGGRNKKYVCSSSTACNWFVRLIKVAKSDNWKISSMQLTHASSCTGEAQPSARQLAELTTLRTRMNSTGSSTPSSDDGPLGALSIDADATSKRVMDFAAEGARLGVKIPVRLAYRAKKILQANSFAYRTSSSSSSSPFNALRYVDVRLLPGRDVREHIASSYRFLPSLLQQFSERNPGSTVSLRKDTRGRFESACVIPAPLRDVLPTLQRAFGLELVPCGHSARPTASPITTTMDDPPAYTGQFIALLGKDGNLEHRVLAFGLIPLPDADSIAWFLRSLQRAGGLLADAPVFIACDAVSAREALRREFPHAHATLCADSKVDAIMQQLPATEASAVTAAATAASNSAFVAHHVRLASVATTCEAFDAHVQALTTHVSSPAMDVLHSLDTTLWTTLLAARYAKTYGWTTTGFRSYMQAGVRSIASHYGGPDASLTAAATSDLHVCGFQLVDFNTMVPLELVYQFLVHYVLVETQRAVDTAVLVASVAAVAGELQSPSPPAADAVQRIALTPAADTLFRQELYESACVAVHASREHAHVAVVTPPFGSNDATYHVRIDGSPRCACATMAQLGIPCRHVIAAARAFKTERVVRTECDRIYTLAVYQTGVQRIVTTAARALDDRLPTLHELNRDASIHPAALLIEDRASEYKESVQMLMRSRTSTASSRHSGVKRQAAGAHDHVSSSLVVLRGKSSGKRRLRVVLSRPNQRDSAARGIMDVSRDWTGANGREDVEGVET